MPPEPVGPEGYFSLLNLFFCLSPIVLVFIAVLVWIIQKNRSRGNETQAMEDATSQISEDEEDYQRGRVYTLLDQKPLTVPILLGGLLVLPLPVISIVTKIIMCNYGLGSDLTGVYLLLPVFIMVGVVLGALAGLIGKVIGLLINWLTKVRSANVIGAAIGSLLAIVSAITIGLFAFAFFMFPDC